MDMTEPSQTMADFDTITNRLIGLYGDPSEEFGCKIHSSSTARNGPHGNDEAVDVLVETILSQNTTDKNSHIAFLNIKQRWPLWSQVIKCDEKDLADAIRIGGLAVIKAARIKKILNTLYERTVEHDPKHAATEPTLHFLDDITSDSEVLARLQELPGVGPKTAACTALFGLGRKCFPVDTHIYRITVKMGLAKPGSRESVQTELEDLIPAHLKFPLHLLLIEHGRHVCTARQAMCGSCVLADLCATGRKTVSRRKAVKKEEKETGEPPAKKVHTDAEEVPVKAEPQVKTEAFD